MANRVVKLRVRVVTGSPQRTFVLHESVRDRDNSDVEIGSWVAGIVLGLQLAYGKESVHFSTQDVQDGIGCSIVVMLTDDVEGHAPAVTTRFD